MRDARRRWVKWQLYATFPLKRGGCGCNDRTECDSKVAHMVSMAGYGEYFVLDSSWNVKAHGEHGSGSEGETGEWSE